MAENLNDPIRLDVANLLTSVTAVSVAALCIQIYYVARSQLDRRWGTDVSVAAVVSVVVGTIAIVVIEANARFVLQVGLLLSLVVFLLVFPTRLIAGLIAGRHWGYLGLANLLGAMVRSFLWFFGILDHSQLAILASLAVTQAAATVFILLASQKAKPPVARWQNHDVRVLLSILLFFLLVTVSVPALRTNLAGDTASYVAGMYVGRSLLFGALVAVCIFIPDLVAPSGDKIELSRRIRTSWLIVLVFVFLATVLAVVSLPSAFEEILRTEKPINRAIALSIVFGWAMIAVIVMPYFQLITLGSRLPFLLVLPVGVIVAGRFSSGGSAPAIAFLLSCALLVLLVVVPFLARNTERVVAIRASAPEGGQPSDGALTVVVPSYNPGRRVVENVTAIHQAFGASPSLRVIVVSDGSTDDSIDALNGIHDPWFRHVVLRTNMGKGAALQRGFDESTSEYTAFIDADGDIPPSLLPGMLRVMVDENADVVFGSKWHPESRLHVSPARWVLSKLHHGLQRLLFRIDISDTQAGIKVYRTSQLRQLAPILREKAFSLDLELFVALSVSGHGRFIETPLIIDRTGSSTIKMRHVVVSFIDMLRIFWRARIALYYNPKINGSTEETKECHEDSPT